MPTKQSKEGPQPALRVSIQRRSGAAGETYEEPPCPVAHKSGQDNAAPGPVYNIPHPLSQTLGLEILSSSFQFLAIGTVDVGRTTDALEPELDKQGGKRQEKVGPEGTAHKGKAQEKVEAVDTQCDQMGALEDGRIAGCLCLESLLFELFRKLEASKVLVGC